MATYVYAVCRAEIRIPSSSTGLGGPLRLLASQGLAVVASDTAGERVRPSRRNLLAHHGVLRALQGQGPVLPLRFGQMFPDDDTARRELLDTRRARIQVLLDRVAEHVELDVELYYGDEDAQLARAIAGEPAATLGALIDRVRAGGGLTERLRLGERSMQALDRLCQADGDRVLASLRAHASHVAVRCRGHHREPFRGAFLVPEGDIEAFDRALEAVAADLPADVRAERIGPLLPFSFADLEEEGSPWA